MRSLPNATLAFAVLAVTSSSMCTALERVSRDGLWKIMAKFGCPPRYIAMVRQFHDGMQARVQNDGEYSEPFPVTNGVKQGCVMAPTLFSMMFSAMLTDAFQDVDAGFPIRYRFDGKLLNLRRLQAKSKVQTDVVDKLLYADDLAEMYDFLAETRNYSIFSGFHCQFIQGH